MKKYSSYKDSGVKWLGQIPSHWELRKSKYLWKESNVLSDTGNEELLSVSQYDGVTPSKSDSRSESLKGYKIVSENDLVINIMLAWLGGLGVSEYNGIVSPAYCIYKKVGDFNPRFLHYLYKTPTYLAEFARHSSGIVPSRWRMYTDDFGQVLTLLPSRAEQDAIVTYLDTATAKIDAAILQQQKMIDLLKERKQIIINSAVTRGLDKNVKMKDSGVEWIGEIPEHWEVRRLKHIGTINSGDSITNKDLKEFDKYPVWGGNGLMGYTNKYNKDKNAIIIGRVGALCGNVRYLSSPTFITDNALIYNIIGSINHQFLFYAMQAANLNSLNTSNAQPLITGTKVKNVKIPFPKDNEQKQIVDYLDLRLDKIDRAITNCDRQIALLQERKQIIINDVVTGKVKVG